METKPYNITVQFTFVVDATSEEVVREKFVGEHQEWLGNLDSLAIESAARDAVVKEVN